MNPEARCRAGSPMLRGSKSRDRLSELLAWPVSFFREEPVGLRRTAFFPPLLSLLSWLGACSRPDQPLSPRLPGPQFSQVAGSSSREKITFQSNRNGNVDVFVMNPDGGDVTQVTSHPFDEYLPLFSPDGSGVTKLTDNNANDYPGRGAAWSRPDGTRILFTSDRGGTGEQNIYVMNADGTGVTQLTPNDGFNDVGPSWSPDATHIVFESNRAGDDQIFVMSADGRGITQLTSGGGVMNSGAHWIRQVAQANDDFATATGVPALPFSSV